jgi:hypothetical protein
MKLNTTYMVVVLDRSRSMEAIRKQMEASFNSFLRKQGSLANLRVSLNQFNGHLSPVYHNRSAKKAPPLSIKPFGRTAIYDAMGLTIERTATFLQHLDPLKRPGHVVVVLITDGQENSSQVFNAKRVRSLVRHFTKNYGWTFTLLSSDKGIMKTAKQIGIAPERVLRFARNINSIRGKDEALALNLAKLRRGEKFSYTKAEREMAKG